MSIGGFTSQHKEMDYERRKRVAIDTGESTYLGGAQKEPQPEGNSMTEKGIGIIGIILICILTGCQPLPVRPEKAPWTATNTPTTIIPRPIP